MGQVPDGTIGQDERIELTGRVAEWTLTEGVAGGEPPAPEDIARFSIAQMIEMTHMTESSTELYLKGASNAQIAKYESDVHEMAMSLAEQAKLTTAGASAREIEGAIASGLKFLRRVLGRRK